MTFPNNLFGLVAIIGIFEIIGSSLKSIITIIPVHSFQSLMMYKYLMSQDLFWFTAHILVIQNPV